MKQNNKGAFTVEAAIIMSGIIIILFAVMYAFMLLYQNVVVVYAASYSAQQGAETWVNSGKDLETGTGHADDGLYYRIAEFNSNSDLVAKKTKKIEDTARSKLAKGILPPKSTNVDVKFENNLIQRTITVDISQKIPFPFMELAQYLGGPNDGLVLKAQAKSAVSEPAEYIRNIDLAMEYVQRLEAFTIGKILSL